MEDKPIRFSQHALLKLKVLEAHEFIVSQEFVEETVSRPEEVMEGYSGRKIAQKVLDAEHVLRVVFEENPDYVLVITLYPGRRSRYDKD